MERYSIKSHDWAGSNTLLTIDFGGGKASENCDKLMKLDLFPHLDGRPRSDFWPASRLLLLSGRVILRIMDRHTQCSRADTCVLLFVQHIIRCGHISRGFFLFFCLRFSLLGLLRFRGPSNGVAVIVVVLVSGTHSILEVRKRVLVSVWCERRGGMWYTLLNYKYSVLVYTNSFIFLHSVWMGVTHLPSV